MGRLGKSVRKQLLWEVSEQLGWRFFKQLDEQFYGQFREQVYEKLEGPLVTQICRQLEEPTTIKHIQRGEPWGSWGYQ